MLTIQKYQTHDNGGRPFNVEIRNITQDNFIVKVETNTKKYSNVFYASEVFIGKSPMNSMTTFSGGHGSIFDGNSILIKTNLNEYVYIGDKVFSFVTESSVISYISPVGNNDVSYPYAILENGEIYLMIEDVVLSNTNALQNYLENPLNDAYSYYYDNHRITPNISVYRTENEMKEYLENFSYYRDIKKFMIGRDQYNMTYSPDPAKNYDRYKTFDDSTDLTNNVEIFVGEQLDRIILTNDMYVEIIESFGALKGFRKFNKTVLCKRIW